MNICFLDLELLEEISYLLCGLRVKVNFQMNAANLSKIKDDKGSSFHRQVSWDGVFSDLRKSAILHF